MQGIVGELDEEIRREIVRTANEHKAKMRMFQLLKVLGKGSYGKFMLMRHKGDGGVYAMKMSRKDNVVKRNQVDHAKTEQFVLEAVNHPFIVSLHYAFQTPEKLHLVLEYCAGVSCSFT